MRRLLAVLSLAVTLLITVAGPAVAQDGGGTTATGTIVDRGAGPDGEDVFVAGVSITVMDEGGAEVGVGVSGDDGVWVVELPSGGKYSALLDESTLPEGVSLRNDPLREFSVTEGQKASLLYPLGERSGSASSNNNISIVQNTVNGIKFGLIIGMSAIGLSLIYGTTGLTNFAHGEIVTFGAMVAFLFNTTGVFGIHFPLIVAALIAMVLGGLFSGVFDLLVWSKLRKRGASLVAMLVVSIGFSILFRYMMLYQFGGRTRVYDDYALQSTIDFGWFSMVPKDIFIVGVSLVVLTVVGLGIQKTRIGKAMRAVADNRDLAESSGIDVERVIRTVWIVGGALAALGGVLYGITESVGWEFGFKLLLLMFAGVTLGGLGTAFGALAGSLIVGIAIQNVSLIPGDFVTSDQQNVAALFALVVILLVRPQGLLGKSERIG